MYLQVRIVSFCRRMYDSFLYYYNANLKQFLLLFAIIKFYLIIFLKFENIFEIVFIVQYNNTNIFISLYIHIYKLAYTSSLIFIFY